MATSGYDDSHPEVAVVFAKMKELGVVPDDVDDPALATFSLTYATGPQPKEELKATISELTEDEDAAGTFVDWCVSAAAV